MHSRQIGHVIVFVKYMGNTSEGPAPRTGLLATPARASAAHALVATAVADHDRAADVAAGSVSEVDEAGQGVGSMNRGGSRL